MRLPFTTDQFLDVLRRYNEAVWPAQWALLLLEVGAVPGRPRPAGRRRDTVLRSCLTHGQAIASRSYPDHRQTGAPRRRIVGMQRCAERASCWKRPRATRGLVCSPLLRLTPP